MTLPPTARSYTIAGLRAGTLIYLSYKKDGYGSVLYGVTSATDVPTAPQIIMGTLAYEDTLLADAGITRDATKGGALFGAVTLGTPADSQFYMEFGGTGFVYVEGFTITAAPPRVRGN